MLVFALSWHFCENGEGNGGIYIDIYDVYMLIYDAYMLRCDVYMFLYEVYMLLYETYTLLYESYTLLYETYMLLYETYSHFCLICIDIWRFGGFSYEGYFVVWFVVNYLYEVWIEAKLMHKLVIILLNKSFNNHVN